MTTMDIYIKQSSFVVGRYASLDNVLSLNWLPLQEQRQLNLLKLVHRALHSPFWPTYLPLRPSSDDILHMRQIKC